ncbi:hypothetical protein D8X80_15635 [Vibrio parahaemolyticus]|nr:hypothetical protein [Vibrio parahaemolyticus]
MIKFHKKKGLALSLMALASFYAFAEYKTDKAPIKSNPTSEVYGIGSSTLPIEQLVEEKMSVTTYKIIKIMEDTNLYAAFTNKGTFIVDSDVNFAIKGKMIDLSNGDNILGRIFGAHKDEIQSIITKEKAIVAFTDSSHKASVKLSDTKPKPQPIPAEPSEHSTNLNSSHEEKINEILRKSPGVQALIKRKLAMEAKQEQLEHQESSDSNKQQPVTHSSIPSVSSAKTPNTIMDELKDIEPHMRQKLGPTYAPMLLPAIDDDSFIVYENDADVPYKGTLTVATDFSCPVCKQLHTLIPSLNAEGVKVRYMPYPRKRIIDYPFENNFTVDQYIYRTHQEPLNSFGELVLNGYCSDDNKAAYNELFSTKSLRDFPSNISKSCETKMREFKILGDLMFAGGTPYLVWGDEDTPASERGYIRGVMRSDRTIFDLLKRKES